MITLQITPSILGIDYGRLNEHLEELAPLSDMFHVDVMDGNFVPNITIGPPVIAKILTHVPLDCHLMIRSPHRYIDEFVKAGAHSITIHAEASLHLKEDIEQIKNAGCKACVAINPETPVEVVAPFLPMLDMVLVMSVHPGFGGQEFISAVLDKVRWIREHYPNLDIQIDGGINDKTAALAVVAGANVLVAGSYILNAEDPMEAVEKLRRG